MGHSFIVLKELHRQAEELKAKSIYLKFCSFELKTIVQSLNEMQSLQGTLKNLNQTKQRLNDQSLILQSMSRTLCNVADRYEACEKKNIRQLDGHMWDGGLYYGLFAMNAVNEATRETRSQMLASETVPFKLGVQQMLAETILSNLTKLPD